MPPPTVTCRLRCVLAMYFAFVGFVAVHWCRESVPCIVAVLGCCVVAMLVAMLVPVALSCRCELLDTSVKGFHVEVCVRLHLF